MAIRVDGICSHAHRAGRQEESGIVDEERAIVVAAFTESSAPRVIQTAAREARRAGPHSELHLVHVFRVGRLDRAPPGGGSDVASVDRAKRYLEGEVRAARNVGNMSVTGHFALGDPTKEILRVARSLDADLVVLGKSDHTLLDRLLMGSVADSVVRAARCSVLVVWQSPRR